MARPSRLSDIGGMDSIKQSLRVAVEWPLLYPEVFAKFGLLQPKGMPLWKVFTVSTNVGIESRFLYLASSLVH
jgi:hypothetical protein